MTSKLFNKNKIRTVIALGKQGFNTRKISDILGCSDETIRRIFILNDIKRENRRHLLIKYEKQIPKLYKFGYSCKKIAEKFKCSPRTVKSVLRQNKILLRRNPWLKKYMHNENYFSKINTWEKSYILGWIISDGNISKNQKYLSIELQKTDKYILEFIMKELNYTGKLYFIARDNTWKFQIYSKQIVKDLEKYGIVPNKCFKTYFPKDLIPKKYWSAFILGIFEGDGSIFPGQDGHLRFKITGTNTLLKEIQKIMIQACNLNKNKIWKEKKSYNLKYGGNKQCRRIYSYLYRNTKIYLKRKKDIFLEVFNA